MEAETTPGSRVALLEALTGALEGLGGVGDQLTPEGCWCPVFVPSDVPPYAHQHTPMCLELRALARRAREAVEWAQRPDNVKLRGLGELQVAQIFEALVEGPNHPNHPWAVEQARTYWKGWKIDLQARLVARARAIESEAGDVPRLV